MVVLRSCEVEARVPLVGGSLAREDLDSVDPHLLEDDEGESVLHHQLPF